MRACAPLPSPRWNAYSSFCVTITNSSTLYPDLAAGESADTPFAPFTFTINADVPCGTPIEFALDSKANEGEWVSALTIVVGQTPLGTACSSCFVPLPSVVPSLGWAGAESLQWAPAGGAKFYDLYRGLHTDLPQLLNEAVDSCKRLTTTALASGALLDEVPAANSIYWYLVGAGNGGGQGAFGSATDGPRIVNDAGVCP